MAKSKARESMREKARAQAESQAKGGGRGTLNIPDGKDVSYFKPVSGRNEIDIIPYIVTNSPGSEKGQLWYKRSIKIHFNVGPEEKIMLCPKTNGENKRCPICEEYFKLRNGTKDEEETAKSIKAKDRDLFQIIDHNDTDKGIQLWDMSYHLFGKLLGEEIRDLDDDAAFFGDLENRASLKIRFKEKSLGKNNFLEADKITFIDADDIKEDMLDDGFELDEILVVPTYEELEKEMMGVGDDGDDESTEKETSKKDDSDEGSKNRCPEDFVYGEDCDDNPKCDDCDEYHACRKEQKRLALEDSGEKDEPVEEKKTTRRRRQ